MGQFYFFFHGQNIHVQIILILKSDKIIRMSMNLETPKKQLDKKLPQTVEKTYRRVETQQPNFKEKTFQLMDTITQMQITQKKYQLKIQQLETQIKSINSSITTLLTRMQVKSLQQVFIKYQHQSILLAQRQNLEHKETLAHISHNLELYKELLIEKKASEAGKDEIITISKIKIDKLEQENKQLRKEIERMEMETDCSRLEWQLTQIKKENKQLKEKLEFAKKEYQGRMIELEKMDELVTEKLQKYQRQMEERQNQYKEQIAKLRENLEEKLKESTQTPKFSSLKSQGDDQFDCYRASIDGLLEENKKLKRYMMTLYNKKEGEQVPQEVERQIKVISNIMQIQQKGY